jgi:hypothetical protein
MEGPIIWSFIQPNCSSTSLLANDSRT